MGAIRSVRHDTWAGIVSMVYLVMMVNLSLVLAALPLVALLITTDPVSSWPLLAVAAPLAAPAVGATPATFTAYGRGENRIARTFWGAWRAGWLKSAALGAMGAAIAVVVLVDFKAVAGSEIAPAVVPLLAVILLVTAVVSMLGLVALGQEPGARLRDVIKASLYLGLRRWYLTLLSFVAIGTQVALFTTMPAIALGITAAPAFYVVWANSRHSLLPVLTTDPADGSAA
jgi:uncharacterized membrane protein YesL